MAGFWDNTSWPAFDERAAAKWFPPIPIYREVLMDTSKRRPDQAMPGAERLQPDEAQAKKISGRDARGRFAPGNIGGPGNPFARKVAALRTALIAAVTDEDIRFIAAQLVVTARLGDMAAIKLLFQYVLGKPAAAVDPDMLDLQELDLYRRAPSPQQAQEMSCERLPADAVADVLRVEMPCLGAQFKDRAAREILGIGPDDECLDDEDDDDLEGHDEAAKREEHRSAVEPGRRQTPPAEYTGGSRSQSGRAPSPNGELVVDPRRRATPPSTNGDSSMVGTQRPANGNGDRECRSSAEPSPDRRPAHGA
jgi:hypothetical protein